MRKKQNKEAQFQNMVVSAEKFLKKDGYSEIYEFPFEALDKTPGGLNLGRIEWHLEFIPGAPQRKKYQHGKRYFEKIHVWATQTRDPRYEKKVFVIPCFVESITADSLRRRSSYFHYVWHMTPCEIHKTMMFSAYPENNHTILRIPIDSTISIEPEFL